MEYIDKAMYSPQVFYSFGENTSIVDRYNAGILKKFMEIARVLCKVRLLSAGMFKGDE